MAERTPSEWRDHLTKVLAERRPEIQVLHDYYDGEHPLPCAPNQANEAYKRLATIAQLNLTALVVDSVVDRLEPIGVTFGAEAANDVWETYWQANDLDAWSAALFLEALISKRAFALVWPGPDGVSITPEMPSEVAVAYAPGSRRERVAAVKEFVADDRRFCTLWLPDSVHYWSAEPRVGWEPWDGADVEDFTTSKANGVQVDNPMGRVPMVEFLAKPDLTGTPHGEITPGVRRVQDRINKTVLDRLIAGEFTAFPQRYALGLEPLDEDGKPRVLASGPNRTWIFPDAPAEVTIGQLDAGDINPYLLCEKADIEGLAAISKTPVYYLATSFANVGLETIAAAAAGHVKKIRGHCRMFGEAAEEVFRLALLADGDDRADDTSCQLEWADPELHTRAEMGDWAVKVNGIIPATEIWKGMGATPQDVERFRAEMAAEALNNALAAPLA